jgi:hypothetical protein
VQIATFDDLSAALLALPKAERLRLAKLLLDVENDEKPSIGE